jgi:hypothetical protein
VIYKGAKLINTGLFATEAKSNRPVYIALLT